MIKKSFTFFRNSEVGALPILILVVVIGFLGFMAIASSAPLKENLYAMLYPKAASFAAEGTVTFNPQIIPLSDPEIGNPMRGALNQFQYFNFPTGWPVADQYERPTWKDLEPSRDQYNFGVFDSMLSRAQNLGGKGGFRIMAAFSGTGAAVPQYLIDMMPKGFWFDYPGSGNTYAPDWNDPDFVDRAGKMLQALGAKYSNDQRLGWVEVGFYGDWSEWHVWQFPYGGQFPNNSTGATPMSLDNKKKLVDLTVQAFPNKQIVMMTDDGETLDYAMKTYPKMGWRRDCWGFDIMDYLLSKNPGWPAAQDRWKTAPVIVESCTMHSGSGAFQLAFDDIKDYHISMASGHNMDAYNSLTSTEKTLINNSYKQAGYRYVLNSVSLPGTISSGSTITVTSQWSNMGVAPIYSGWNVLYRLRSISSGKIVWESKSSADLQTVLPGTPVNINDSFVIPAQIEVGNYELLVQITDPSGYYKPLNLGIIGKQTDGSYVIGSVAVISGSVVLPSSSVTPTSAPTPIPTSSPTPRPTVLPSVVVTAPPTPLPTIVPTRSPSPVVTSQSKYLSDLGFTVIKNGWGGVERDMSNGEDKSGDGKLIKINGISYSKGLGAHAFSEISYQLNGKCTRFKSLIGIDDETNGKGSAWFTVTADGKKLYTSPTIKGKSNATSIDVDVTGKKTLLLTLSNGGDNDYFDHGDWAMARIECSF